MSRKRFINKKYRKKRFFFFTVFLLVLIIGIGYSAISMNLGIGGSLTLSKYGAFSITLDNQGATSPGSNYIYEIESLGYYLDDAGQNQMTGSSYAITVPLKTGFVFNGYYTEQNGAGTEYIDEDGFITPNASANYLSRGGKLYAFWVTETSTPEITICKITNNNNLQDVFNIKISNTSFETWVELKKDECKTVNVSIGEYQILELDKLGYSNGSVDGISQNGGTLNARKNKEYTVTFYNNYSADSYFYNYGSTKSTLGGS